MPRRHPLHTGLCALMLLAVTLPAIAETTWQRVARTGNIVIGYRESSIPFSYLDAQGRPQGYAIDLCRHLVDALNKRLGRELRREYRPVTSANRIDLVASGQVDLECGSTTNNAERRKQVAFTVPHFISAIRFMVRADSGLRKHADLSRAVIVTTRGATAEKLFREIDPAARLLLAPDHAAAFAMLAAGQADAFMMDDILLASLRAASKNPDDYRLLDNTYRIEQLAIMLGKDDPEFKAIVDGEMKRLIAGGELQRAYRTWFEQPIPPGGINLRWPMSFLLRDSLRFPSATAAD